MAEVFSGTKPNIHILMDNEAAQSMAEFAKFSDKTKHMRIAESFAHEKVSDGTIKLHHIGTASNLADIFTKGLGRIAFTRIRDVLLGCHIDTCTEDGNM